MKKFGWLLVACALAIGCGGSDAVSVPENVPEPPAEDPTSATEGQSNPLDNVEPEPEPGN